MMQFGHVTFESHPHISGIVGWGVAIWSKGRRSGLRIPTEVWLSVEVMFKSIPWLVEIT